MSQITIIVKKDTARPFCDRTHTKIGCRAGEQARLEFDARAAATAARPAEGSAGGGGG